MITRINAFYGRQSVDKKDSISIESQLEFSKHEFRGENYREYKDKGYSGKNTDRPRFQELIRDIEQGLIAKVVVYKLDRISRSIIDFANMMELFQRYNVEFVSATEKFDTSAPMGRAMLNICIVFAQLERETIQRRVQDAYYSRCERGFHMSGKAPFGYRLEPTVVDGIRTKMMATDPETADLVKLMFEMYAEPQTSFGDIARYFTENNIPFNGGELQRGTLSQLLRNPVYAQADLEIYEFFKSQGAAVVNDAADFAGMNGCYLYQGRDVPERKQTNLKDHILVIAPHEGLVPSETWLACRKKLMNNTCFSGTHKAKNTWLAGKVKCGKCGAGLMGLINATGAGYFRCRKRTDNRSCEGCGTLRVRDMEDFIYREMRRKMTAFQTLTGGNPAKANPKLTALNVELAQTEAEIEKLINTLTGANATLMTYANSKIEELDGQRQSLMKRIADMTAEAISPEQIERISGYLENWDGISFEDRRLVADGLFSGIRATSDSVQVEWKI
jgi:DNA invertase Pin-like site-specific DNA recombinase